MVAVNGSLMACNANSFFSGKSETATMLEKPTLSANILYNSFLKEFRLTLSITSTKLFFK
jgi:hypothetical protein